MPDIEGQESPEMYLKTIYLIHKEEGRCRSVDIANRLGVSKPSVSVAVRKLENEQFLQISEDGLIALTEEGLDRAKITYDKYCFWIDFFENLGFTPQEADEEACRFEHSMSDEAFLKMKSALEK